MRPITMERSNQGDLFVPFQAFHEAGMDQLGHVTYDEMRAKELLLRGMVARRAVLFAGPPGGAKSLLAERAGGLIEDYDDDQHLAVVPPSPTLKDERLVGGRMQTVKSINDGDSARSEITTIDIEAIVKPETMIIFNDEGTRINPMAMNSLLGAAEERVLKTTAGRIALGNLVLMVTTMNPSETNQATFKMSDAMASRHFGGDVLGDDLSDGNAVKLLQGITPESARMRPVTTSSDLRGMYDRLQGIRIPSEEALYGVRLVDVAKKLLAQEFGIKEANRMYEQVGDLAKVGGAFRGRTATMDDMRKALRFAVTSRIGAKEQSLDLNKDIDEFTEQVVSATPLPNRS